MDKGVRGWGGTGTLSSASASSGTAEEVKNNERITTEKQPERAPDFAYLIRRHSLLIYRLALLGMPKDEQQKFIDEYVESEANWRQHDLYESKTLWKIIELFHAVYDEDDVSDAIRSLLRDLSTIRMVHETATRDKRSIRDILNEKQKLLNDSREVAASLIRYAEKLDNIDESYARKARTFARSIERDKDLLCREYEIIGELLDTGLLPTRGPANARGEPIGWYIRIIDHRIPDGLPNRYAAIATLLLSVGIEVSNAYVRSTLKVGRT